ncbi:hypothetical protein CRENBAI_024660 [Crenichthys baileyi]|uniref:Tubulin epsilon and delta complex protein 1 domain-containing protein n=1 Tax=Crenichthys baileyi TaxID=28760 RepID=A0AAV9S3I9_9TELE
MQRSKAVTVEVKRVIEALCRLLATLGLDPVPAPEAFRRAKFGGRFQEDLLWQLLSNILQMSGIISSETSSQLSGERRKLVAVGLWQSGYYCDWMYGTDGGSFSSRDLLLALGWLLAKGAMEKMLTGRVEQLDRTLLPSAPEKREFSGELELDAASLRRLQWLMGHLRHQGRTLLSTVGVRTRVLHDFREYHLLLQELRLDDGRFQRYFRLGPSSKICCPALGDESASRTPTTGAVSPLLNACPSVFGQVLSVLVSPHPVPDWLTRCEFRKKFSIFNSSIALALPLLRTAFRAVSFAPRRAAPLLNAPLHRDNT